MFVDISILLNKTVTNLWDKTQVQQIKTIIGASQALVGQAALPWGLRGGREPSPDLSRVSGWCGHRAPSGPCSGGSRSARRGFGGQLPGAPISAASQGLLRPMGGWALRADPPKLPPGLPGPGGPQQTHTPWTGRASFQARLRRGRALCLAQRRGHWASGTPEKSLRGRRACDTGCCAQVSLR